MKRFLFFLLSGFVLILLAAPWFVGSFAERQLETQLTRELAASPGIAVVTEEYRRRWFSADSRHRLVVTDPEIVTALRALTDEQAFGDQPALVVETRIDHGPLPFSSLERDDGSLRPALSRARSTFTFDLGNRTEPVPLPGELLTTLGMDGTTEASFHLSAGSHELAGSGDRLEWEGAKIDARIGRDGRTITSEGELRPFRLDTAEGSIDVGRIGFETDQRQTRFGIPVGKVDVLTGPMRVTTPGAGETRIESIRISSDSTLEGELLSGTTSLAIGEIGTGFGALRLRSDLVVTNLHAPSLRTLTATMQRLEAEQRSSALEQIYPQVEADVARLVAAGPTVDLRDLVVDLPQGELRLRSYLAVAADGTGTSVTPRDILSRLTATADLELPVALLEMLAEANPETAGQIQMFIDTGILRRDGESYRVQAEYGDGLLTVNGFPLPVPLGP